MKITSFYYLQYPDNSPADPEDADSEVRIEVGEDSASIDQFDCCYSLRVLTPKRLTALLDASPSGCLALTATLVVERFDDALILRALEALLPDLGNFAVRV